MSESTLKPLGKLDDNTDKKQQPTLNHLRALDGEEKVFLVKQKIMQFPFLARVR
jgi:hypothetical protein